MPVSPSVRALVLSLLALAASASFPGCSDASSEGPAPDSTALEGEALAPCSSGDFLIPAPARPVSGAVEGAASYVPTGKGTVRFHGRATGEASWVAGNPNDLAYAYFVEEPGGRVSFDVRLDEDLAGSSGSSGSSGSPGKERTVTVRLSHVWKPGADGQLCSAPKASLSIHENIEEEAVDALAGSVDVRAFDPDAHRVALSFEAETTAYKIFVDLDVKGTPR